MEKYAVPLILGTLALVIGIALKLFVGRRIFYRRNAAGREGFKNYRNALLTPFIESVLTKIGGLLIIFGLLCFLWAWIK